MTRRRVLANRIKKSLVENCGMFRQNSPSGGFLHRRECAEIAKTGCIKATATATGSTRSSGSPAANPQVLQDRAEAYAQTADIALVTRYGVAARRQNRAD